MCYFYIYTSCSQTVYNVMCLTSNVLKSSLLNDLKVLYVVNLNLNHQKLVARGQWMYGIKKQDTVLRPWHTTDQVSLCQISARPYFQGMVQVLRCLSTVPEKYSDLVY